MLAGTAVRLVARPIEEWPGPLTPDDQRSYSPFTASWTDTVALLEKEVGMLASHDATVVMQLAITERDCRLDGWIRADARPTHPGVIIAFDSKHGPLRYSTDVHKGGGQWGKLPGWQANVRAIALGLEALRKVDRYGIARGGEQYRGWKAIPQTTFSPESAKAVLVQIAIPSGFDHGAWEPRQLYRQALKKAHPDHGGSRELLEQVQDAGRKLGLA